MKRGEARTPGPSGGGRTPAPHGSALAQPLSMPSAARFAAYTGLLVLGAVVGAAGSLVQSAWFPGGLLLALLASAGLFLGGGRATGTRAGAVAPAAGWMVSVVLLTTSRPEGDIVFAAGAGTYLFLLGGMAVAVICATFGPVRQPEDVGTRLVK